MKPRDRTSILLVLASLLAALAAPSVAAAAERGKQPAAGAQLTERQQKKRKSRGIYWGAWLGDQLTGEEAPWDMGAVHRFEEEVGKGLSLIEFSSPFTDCNEIPCTYYRFPTEQMQKIRAYGAIPVFSWNSASSRGETNDADFQLADLIGGAHDRYIAEFAAEARDWGQPFFLRFNWEMNGDWFPWAEAVNGNRRGQYVAAWRHVHDIFTAAGATNATWVWCPYADAGKRLRPIGSLYPGHAYVDWTCLDGFNWGKNSVNPQPWRNFDQLFGLPYRHLTKHIAPRKPILLAEFATNGKGRAKRLWLNRMFRRIARKYRRIRGIVWFDKIDRGIHWPIENSGARSAFARGLSKGPYRQNAFAEITARPIRPPR